MSFRSLRVRCAAPLRRLVPLLPAALVAWAATGALCPAAGQPPPVRVTPVGDLLPAPYADPVRSVRLVSTLLELHPERLDLHLALAREATALGVLAPTAEARMASLEEAVAAGRRAVELAPDAAEARYWLAASLGLLADQEGGGTKISLAREAYGAALATLELDPDHGGAHHIVGRLHAGAKRLSWVTRLIARGLGLGEILDEASWESAEEHMRRAVEDAPGQPVHHYELGRLLVEAGSDPEEGRAILAGMAARDARHPLEAHYIARARRSLEELGGPEGVSPGR